MTSIKVVLRRKQNKDGSFPLALRITRDRKTSFIHLGYNLSDKDWDSSVQRVKKSHGNSVRLNAFIAAKVLEVTNTSLEMDTAKQVVTARAITKKVKPHTGNSVYAQADLYIQRLKDDGKYNRWNSEKSNVKHLKEFLGRDISFQELTVSMLQRFKAHLIAKNKVSERTAINNWVTVRSIFSQAIKDGACDAKFYPFGKGKIKIKFPDSNKIGLTMEEVTKVETAELSGDADHARNLWLISFYFAGMRVSDVLRLKWADFKDGRLFYTMGKNKKSDSLKVSAKVQEILKTYEGRRDKTTDLVFDDIRYADLSSKFDTEMKIKSRINVIDRLLRTEVAPAAEIDKPLTMHIARHSFGNISGDKIPVQMLQKLYRHTDIKTTIGYQANFIHSDVDNALDAVIGV